MDNGSEFVSKVLDKLTYDNHVVFDFSRPGKPTDNAFAKSFIGSFRDECLNVNWFLSLEDARDKIEQWRQDYNGFRPHSSLEDFTPNVCKTSDSDSSLKPENSILEWINFGRSLTTQKSNSPPGAIIGAGYTLCGNFIRRIHA